MKILAGMIAMLLMAGSAAAQEDRSAAELIEEGALEQAQIDSKVMDFQGQAAFGEEEAREPQASQWVWGEIKSVDFAGSSLVIKRFEYETAEEVDKAILVDDKTVFQGVMGLADIEPTMVVTVDYKERGGRSVADVIEVESDQGE